MRMEDRLKDTYLSLFFKTVEALIYKLVEFIGERNGIFLALLLA